MGGARRIGPFAPIPVHSQPFFVCFVYLFVSDGAFTRMARLHDMQKTVINKHHPPIEISLKNKIPFSILLQLFFTHPFCWFCMNIRGCFFVCFFLSWQTLWGFFFLLFLCCWYCWQSSHCVRLHLREYGEINARSHWTSITCAGSFLRSSRIRSACSYALCA